jgi:hypothetical protein
MGKGKIAAQCCHAAVGVVMDLCESEEGHRLMTQWVSLLPDRSARKSPHFKIGQNIVISLL